MKLSFEDIIIIDKQYLAYLHSFDSKVMTNHENAKDRPNVAVLVDDNGQKWAIPLSHSKGKGKKVSFWDIPGDKGHLQFSNIIPLVTNTYKTAHSSQDFDYDQLLRIQENYIKNNFEKEVVPRFTEAFNIHQRSKTKPKNKFYQIYIDFTLLLKKARKWEEISKAEVFIERAMKLVPPDKERAQGILIKALGREEYRDVLKYRENTKKRFEQINDDFTREESLRKDMLEMIRREEEKQTNQFDKSDRVKRKDDNEREKD